ncbi:GntR family transcriptional regulator [Paenibacillus humicola]|uniref:GntR family transcriptional regulator n=1 Tax=Paenibacillus humicola TaxID=3110540 RepID=UPI00237C4AC6|nr:GntR family transcriptional regulator [Paenibacillus humicola]
MELKNGPTPLYIQLKEIIQERIDNNIYQVGQQIPPELQFVQEFGISRPTVRQALSELMQEGRLTVKRGIGTFVTAKPMNTNANRFITFAEQMKMSGMKERAVLMRKGTMPATRKLSAELGIEPDAEVYEIIRVRYGDEEPLAIRCSYIAVSLHPNLLDRDLEQTPLFETLSRDCGIVATRARQTYQAVPATELEAKWLTVPEGSPLMMSTGVIYSDRGLPIESVKVLYKGNRYQFTVDQAGDGGSHVLNNEWIGMA